MWSSFFIWCQFAMNWQVLRGIGSHDNIQRAFPQFRFFFTLTTWECSAQRWDPLISKGKERLYKPHSFAISSPTDCDHAASTHLLLYWTNETALCCLWISHDARFVVKGKKVPYYFESFLFFHTVEHLLIECPRLEECRVLGVIWLRVSTGLAGTTPNRC